MDSKKRPTKDEIVIDVNKCQIAFLEDDRYVTVQFNKNSKGMNNPFGYVCGIACAQQTPTQGGQPTAWEGTDLAFVMALFKEMGTRAGPEGFIRNWTNFGLGQTGKPPRCTILLGDPPVVPPKLEILACSLFGHADKHRFLGERGGDPNAWIYWRITFVSETEELRELKKAVERCQAKNGQVPGSVESLKQGGRKTGENESQPAAAPEGLRKYLETAHARLERLSLPDAVREGKRSCLYRPRRFLGPLEGSAANSDGAEAPDREGSKPIRRESELLERLMAKRNPLRLCILGDAGSGKSTLLEQLTFAMASSCLSVGDFQNGRIPFLLDLDQWDQGEHRTLESFVVQQTPQLDAALVHRLCETGQAVLLLDGLDEVSAKHGRRGALLQWLDRQIVEQQFSQCGIVIAGRPWAFDWGFLRQMRSHWVSLAPLEAGDITTYITRYHSDDPAHARRLWRQIQSEGGILSLVQQPLLLMLFCFVASGKTAALPVSEVDLLEKALRALLRSRKLPEEKSLFALGALAWFCWSHGETGFPTSRGNQLIAQAQSGKNDAASDAQRAEADRLLNALARRSGILQVEASQCLFVEQTYLEFLAARWLVTQIGTRIQRVFADHVWDPKWRRFMEFLVSWLWKNERRTAMGLVRWLLDEIGAGRDDMWGNLALLAGRFLIGAGQARDVDETALGLEALKPVIAAWQFAALNRDYQEDRVAAHMTVVGIASFLPAETTNRLREFLEQPEIASYAAEALALVGSDAACEALVHKLESSMEAELRCGLVSAIGSMGSTHAFNALRLAVKDPQASVRSAAVEALGAFRFDDAATQTIIAALKDADPSVRATAAGVLGTMRVDEAVPSLAILLSDREEAVRQAAAKALAEIGNGPAKQALIDALDNGKPAHREDVIEALGGWQDDLVIEALNRALRSKSEVIRTESARLLGEAKAQKSRIRLCDALTDPCDEVREAAADALGLIAQPEAGANLVRATKDPDPHVRFAAIRALGRIGSKFPSIAALREALGDPDKRVHREASLALVPSLGWDCGQAIEAIVQTLDGKDSKLTENAAELLGWLGTKDNPDLRDAFASEVAIQLRHEVILRAVPVLISAAEKQAGKALRFVIGALGAIGSGQAVTALLGMLAKGRPEVRQLAANQLGSTQSPVVVKELVAALNDSEQMVRRNAARALVDIGAEEAADGLLRIADDADPDIRYRAIWGLAKIGCTKAEDVLIQAACDDNTRLACRAVEGLAKIRTVAAISTLISLLRSSDAELRRATAQSLGGIDEPRVIEALCLVVSDPDFWVRKTAVESLGKTASDTASDVLIRVLEEDGGWLDQAKADTVHSTDPMAGIMEAARRQQKMDCWIAAVDALGQIGSDRVVDALIRIRMGGDTYAGWGAVRALHSIRTPYALNALARAALAGASWAGKLVSTAGVKTEASPSSLKDERPPCVI